MVRVAGLKGQARELIATMSDDGLSPAEQLAPSTPSSTTLVLQQRADWTKLRQELADTGIVIVAGGCARPRRSRLAGRLFPRFDLPGADAARHRPGASVPVHPQSRLHARPAACRQEGPRHAGADPRARQPRALHPAAACRRGPGAAPLRHAGRRGQPVHPAALPRLRGERQGRVPPHPRLRTSKSRKRPRISSASSSAR